MIQLALEQFSQIFFSVDYTALNDWQNSVVIIFSLALVWAFLSGLWRIFKRIFKLGWL